MHFLRNLLGEKADLGATMETRTISPSSNVALISTAARVTPTPPRAAKFGEVLANTAVRTAESAMSSLPGAPMMALAVRGGAASVPLGTSASALSTPATAGKAAEGPTATGTTSTNPLGGAGSIGTSLDGGGNIETALQQSQEMNLQMLLVQQRVQEQNQHFTTMSNVMKAEHDTVKTAIGNIR